METDTPSGRTRECGETAWALVMLPVAVGLFVLVFHDRFDFEGFWEFFPFRAFARQAVAEGIFPAWMPGIRCGFPVLASVETGIANPLNLAVGGPAGYLLFAILTLVASGFWTWRFFRRLGAEPLPAAVATLPWIVGTISLHWYSNVNNLFVFALFPATLAAAEGYLAGHAVSLLYLVLAVVGTLVGGHPQIAAFNLIAAALYLLARIVLARRAGATRLRPIAGLAAAAVLGAALAAYQILPLAELIGQTARPEVGDEFRAMGSLTPAMLGHFIVPRAFDFPRMGEVDYLPYAGVLVLLAAAATVRRSASRRVVSLWIAVAALVVLALGPGTPAFDLLALLPGFSMLRKSYWFAGHATFFLCALAAIGLSRRRAGSAAAGVRWTALPVLAAVVAVGIAVSFHDGRAGIREANASPWAASALFLALSAGVFLVLRRSRGTAAWSLAALVVVLDLFACCFWKEAPRGASIFETALLKPSPAARWMLREGDAGARMAFLPGTIYDAGMKDVDSVPSAETDVAWGVRTFWGWDEPSLAPRRMVSAVERLFDRRVDVSYLSLAHVGLVWAGGPLREPGLVRVFEWDEGVLYRNPTALPRAYLAPGVRSVGDAEEALSALAAEGFDPLAETVVEGMVRVAVRDAPEAVAVPVDRAGSADMAVDADRPSLLVFTESFGPGWRAHVDGEPAAVVTVNTQFQGVVVPAGAHRVEFRYQSPAVRAGLLVSAVALGLLVALAVVLAVRGGRTTGSA